MKKIIVVVFAALALTVALALAPSAFAQSPAPTCSAALQALTAAQQKAVLSQAEVDKLKVAQTPLDAAVVAAQKLVDAVTSETPVAQVAILQAALTAAKNAANVGDAKLQAAITADAAADAAVVAAQAAADKACKGDPGATVTTTAPPPAPVIVTIPSAINTGLA